MLLTSCWFHPFQLLANPLHARVQTAAPWRTSGARAPLGAHLHPRGFGAQGGLGLSPMCLSRAAGPEENVPNPLSLFIVAGNGLKTHGDEEGAQTSPGGSRLQFPCVIFLPPTPNFSFPAGCHVRSMSFQSKRNRRQSLE